MKRWQVILLCVGVSLIVNVCVAKYERAAAAIDQKCNKVLPAQSIA